MKRKELLDEQKVKNEIDRYQGKQQKLESKVKELLSDIEDKNNQIKKL